MMEEEASSSKKGCVLAILFIVVAGLFLLDPFHRFGEEETVSPKEKTKTEQAVAGEENKGASYHGGYIVYVTGAVKHPGVYELPAGAHVFDAVKAAGDVIPYADLEAVPMEEEIETHRKIHIPLDPNRMDPSAQGIVNINTADEKELESLPGIGKTTAKKIINYRDENGPFQNKEDLKHVPSIGEGKYSKLADKITL